MSVICRVCCCADIETGGYGGIGRRARFRFWCLRRAGSSPVIRRNENSRKFTGFSNKISSFRLALYPKNFLSHVPEEICISAVTYAELMYGVEKSMAIEKNRIALSLFLSPLTILEFQALAAEEYGKVRAELESKGTPIGPMDLLIAGHARPEGFILVTNNTREFCRVDGLVVEDWTKEQAGVEKGSVSRNAVGL